MIARPPTDLRRRIWRVIRIGLGSSLLIVGMIGLVLPILQGVALIIAGLAVLATELPWARRWLHNLRGWLRRLGPRGSDRRARRSGQEREEGDARGGGQAG